MDIFVEGVNISFVGFYRDFLYLCQYIDVPTIVRGYTMLTNIMQISINYNISTEDTDLYIPTVVQYPNEKMLTSSALTRTIYL